MSPFLFISLALLALGATLPAPGLVVAGALLGLVTGLRSLWQRRGLGGITYERRLATDRAVWGDEVPFSLIVRNRSIVPVAWLRADDYVSDTATIRDRALERSDRAGFGTLRNGWALLPFERVERRLAIVADRRGRYRLGPVRLEVADLFGGQAATEVREVVDAYTVQPRMVAVGSIARASVLRPRERPTTGLTEDPALYAGLRPYQSGDPPRRIHWKAMARTGIVRSKRFDASREREMILALDIQTAEGPSWRIAYDEDLVEALCVTAASMVREGVAAGGSCGLAVAAYTGRLATQTRIPAAAGDAQLLRITDALARVSAFPSGPFEGLLAALPRWISRDATVITLSARDPAPYAAILARLVRQGTPVRHMAMGRGAGAAAERLRAVGISAVTARLEPDWRTADALALAG